jgi:hypothetical protein
VIIVKASLELQNYNYQNTSEMKLQLKVVWGALGLNTKSRKVLNGRSLTLTLLTCDD